MKTDAHAFKTFPEFSKLTLADRELYEELIAQYPPIDEITFPILMTWWSDLGDCMVALLNGNLVICYWRPGDEKNSGLCLVGNKLIDESMATIFDWLRAQGELMHLVHVPEFVVSSMKYPEMYTFTSERGYDECIVSVKTLCSLSKMIQYRRWKIRRFKSEVNDERVVLKNLDLDSDQNQELLLEAMDRWKIKGRLNVINKREEEILKVCIRQASDFGYENVCLFIDGELHSFLLYQLTTDPDYVIVDYSRYSYAAPHLFEFAVYEYAQYLRDLDITYANIVLDMDVPILRTVKLALGPRNFFRKYTVQPKQ
ncbi:MAG TPA: phosphatidylglycerol lysyltransferase domain-containing protein [Verrucomicrobiae bacterium]|nr:phosphatidylglycerol lysyltransferase domain-containing protein [Verrucomicrobiae bacterium]